jgi:hypothetical protein
MAQKFFPKPKKPTPVGVGPPAIPFEFDPPGNDFEGGHISGPTPARKKCRK